MKVYCVFCEEGYSIMLYRVYKTPEAAQEYIEFLQKATAGSDLYYFIEEETLYE